MGVIAVSFGQFLPHVFVMACLGIAWDLIIRAFTGGRF